jgi:hypothetical protein
MLEKKRKKGSGRQKTKDKRQKTKDKRQKTKDKRQKTKDKGQKHRRTCRIPKQKGYGRSGDNTGYNSDSTPSI